MSNSISGSIHSKIEAGNFVDSMFAGAIDSDKKQTLPNFTMLNFENTINDLIKVANCRYITFAPLVDNTTRNGWEAYAAKNVHLPNRKHPAWIWIVFSHITRVMAAHKLR